MDLMSLLLFAAPRRNVQYGVLATKFRLTFSFDNEGLCAGVQERWRI